MPVWDFKCVSTKYFNILYSFSITVLETFLGFSVCFIRVTNCETHICSHTEEL